MSSPSDSSSCTSECDLESFTVEEVMGELSEFAPYDDSCEPLATEEETADYNERVHREEEEEQQFQRRYSGEVPANEWCSRSNCSVSLVTKAQECICCKEIDRCEEVMVEAIGDRTVCITLHPGFESVCLNRYVLEVAALGLKTRAGKSYTTVRGQSNKSDNEFLRSVAYRQFTRLLWSYIGSSRRYPLPCCAYNKIRKQFPSQNGHYRGFEDEENE
ncbi:unnamed protein product [Porites lobata]|uniref:P2X purinoreceptor 7 intracellular domain-containing protein n=1 Tax=Porites lobata TaxID=104759 RepID=A0ABN8NNA7_9CNID|nr:unnamed protein product [Porites lobata]